MKYNVVYRPKSAMGRGAIDSLCSQCTCGNGLLRFFIHEASLETKEQAEQTRLNLMHYYKNLEFFVVPQYGTRFNTLKVGG